MKLAVLGAGAWGTAISISLAPRHAVTLWARDGAQARTLAATRTNDRYLPGLSIPQNVEVVAECAAALAGCDLALVATPTAGLRPTLNALAAANNTAPLLWLCKGFETDSAQLPFEIADTEVPPHLRGDLEPGQGFACERWHGGFLKKGKNLVCVWCLR